MQSERYSHYAPYLPTGQIARDPPRKNTSSESSTKRYELQKLWYDISSKSSEMIWGSKAPKRHDLRKLWNSMSPKSSTIWYELRKLWNDLSSESSDGIWALKSSEMVWASKALKWHEVRKLWWDMSFESSETTWALRALWNNASSESSTIWYELRQLRQIWAPRALLSPMWAPKAHRPIDASSESSLTDTSFESSADRHKLRELYNWQIL